MRIDILNLEMAYEALTCSMLAFVQNRPWNKIYTNAEILDMSGTIPYFRVYQNKVFEENEYAPDIESDCGIFSALLYIRDQIFAQTGKRIWGLTFTLYPDGKYEIEYDYNVPEGFNEQGEYIGEEYENDEISEFFENIRNIGTDEFELK